jgi:hypothetical protein
MRKKDGERCENVDDLNPETGLCKFHDPTRAQEMFEQRSKAGKSNSRQFKLRAQSGSVPRPPETAEDAIKWCAWAAHRVAVGEMDARTCDSISRVMNVFKSAIKERDLMREVTKLRAELKAMRAKKGAAKR